MCAVLKGSQFAYCGFKAAILSPGTFTSLDLSLVLDYFWFRRCLGDEGLFVIYQGADGLIKGPNKLTANE